MKNPKKVKFEKDKTYHFKKCETCKGQDGKKKDIYETFQSAFDTAKHLEETRGIFLTVYKCPNGDGWHLTKNDDPCGVSERKGELFQKNNIPVSSFDGSWEYVGDDNTDSEFYSIRFAKKQKKKNL